MGERGSHGSPLSRQPLLGGGAGEVRLSLHVEEGSHWSGFLQLHPVAQVIGIEY